MSGSAFFPAMIEKFLKVGPCKVTNNVREALGSQRHRQ
jgi:hypothetical protein